MNRGFIGWIIIIIAVLAALHYFLGWNIFDVLNSDAGQATLGYIGDILSTVWGWIKGPINWILGMIR